MRASDRQESRVWGRNWPMATSDVTLKTEQPRAVVGRSGEVVNDFSIQVATVNGSGSQSANNVLLKSIFAMGVPISGKNLFPSNIAGLPTWFTIRASKQGYIARKKEIDIVVAMNAETAKDDVLSLATGGVAIYEEAANLKQYRDDVTCYPVPFDKCMSAWSRSFWIWIWPQWKPLCGASSLRSRRRPISTGPRYRQVTTTRRRHW
jgi:hypothetical protein